MSALRARGPCVRHGVQLLPQAREDAHRRSFRVHPLLTKKLQNFFNSCPFQREAGLRWSLTKDFLMNTVIKILVIVVLILLICHLC